MSGPSTSTDENAIVDLSEYLKKIELKCFRCGDLCSGTECQRMEVVQLICRPVAGDKSSTKTKGQNQLDYLGMMSDNCVNCDARFFEDEIVGQEPDAIDFCCKSGSIQTRNPFADFPEVLKEQFEKRWYRNYIVKNNSDVAFAKFERTPMDWFPDVKDGWKRPNWKCFGEVQHAAICPEDYSGHCSSKDVEEWLIRNNSIAKAYNLIPKLAICKCDKDPTKKMCCSVVNPIKFLLSLHTSQEVPDLDSKDMALSNDNPLVDPMMYPFFYPYGAVGWNPDLGITQMEYYRYFSMIRESYNPLHHGGLLTRQYFMDLWARIDQIRLLNCLDSQEHSTVLPASYPGSYRNLAEEYLDSLAVLSRFGKPDFHIIFTCNEEWQEIQENLVNGQEAHDRPDLIARVFKLKVDRMLDHLIEKKLLGKVFAYAYSYEWQKRGLPHIHLALTLEEQFGSPKKIARRISTELPNKSSQPDLYKTVKKRMMDDNGEIAAYNPDLLRIFDAHINVKECWGDRHGLYRYIHKGHDEKANIDWRKKIGDEHFDEFEHYLENRSFCAPEACHRLFEFPVFQRSHQVHRLPIHLPFEQAKRTQLTEYFKMNSTLSSKLSYLDFPSKFNWTGKQWEEKGVSEERPIGRFQAVLPTDNELFALRLLLISTPGATSFEDLLKISNTDGPSDIKETFFEAAQARELYTDEVWKQGFRESILLMSFHEMRLMFAEIMKKYVKNKNDFWETFENDLLKDLIAEEVEYYEARRRVRGEIDDMMKRFD